MSDPVPVVTEDGYTLTARWHRSTTRSDRVLVVAGGTAVPQRFYRHFAEHAVRRGWSVHTFDYRGIGESEPTGGRQIRLDHQEWARLDLAAVVERAATRGPVDFVGHSFGGQALGLLPRPELVRAAHVVGTGSGYLPWLPPPERLRARLLRLTGPMLIRLTGRVPGSRLRLGADMHAGVFRQWCRWSRYPRHWFDDPDVGDRMRNDFSRCTFPVLAWSATDDPWVTPRSRDAFVQHFPLVSTREIRPGSYGAGRIGHVGYFRPALRDLWDEILTLLLVSRPR